MLAAEEESGRSVFAVYVRGADMRAEINFYPDEQAALADVGPGMPPGLLTHGETYIEYVGDAWLFAPESTPLIGVPTDRLVQLQADDLEIFVALTAQESQALVAVGAGAQQGFGATDDPSAVAVAEVARVDAPSGLTGAQPCAIWRSDGRLVVFEAGAAEGGRPLPEALSRGEFGDEVSNDLAVVRLLDEGWAPLVVDTHTWREIGDDWAINVQQRVADDGEEQFLARYTAYDRTLVVTRSATDTGLDEEHLQLLSDDVDCEFDVLVGLLSEADWAVDVETTAAAELSVHPELSESPGWYPAESEDGIEWVAALERRSR